jgi:hypothetical protein
MGSGASTMGKNSPTQKLRRGRSMVPSGVAAAAKFGEKFRLHGSIPRHDSDRQSPQSTRHTARMPRCPPPRCEQNVILAAGRRWLPDMVRWLWGAEARIYIPELRASTESVAIHPEHITARSAMMGASSERVLRLSRQMRARG